MNGELRAMGEIDAPLYVLTDEESGGVLVAAEDVEGFFIDQEEESPEVVFLRAHQVSKSRRKIEGAILKIVNIRGETVGEYLINRVVLGNVNAEWSDGKTSSVAYRFFGNRCEYPGAAEIWRRWASGAALKKDEWLQWPEEYQDAWLHVVQNRWFATNHRAARYGVDDVVILDGTHIVTRAGFYCALGEAVNGPGGYFGSNLDALADCLSSDFGNTALMKVVWQNHRASQESLGRDFLDSIVAVMREFHVEVVAR